MFPLESMTENRNIKKTHEKTWAIEKIETYVYKHSLDDAWAGLTNPGDSIFNMKKKLFWGDIFMLDINDFWTEINDLHRFPWTSSTLSNCSSELRKSLEMLRHAFNIRNARSRDWRAPYSMGFTVRVRKKSNLDSIFQIFLDSRHGPFHIKVILSISHYYPSIIARFLHVVQKFFERILELIGFE